MTMAILYFLIACVVLDVLTVYASKVNQRRKAAAAAHQKREALQARQDAAERKAAEKKRAAAFLIEQKNREYYKLLNARRQEWLIYQNMLSEYNDASEKRKPGLYKKLSAQKQKIDKIDLKISSVQFTIKSAKTAA